MGKTDSRKDTAATLAILMETADELDRRSCGARDRKSRAQRCAASLIRAQVKLHEFYVERWGYISEEIS